METLRRKSPLHSGTFNSAQPLPARTHPAEPALRNAHWIYAAVALLITSLLALLTPPFGIPDEPAHILRAIQVSHGEFLVCPSPHSAGAPEDTALLEEFSYFLSIHARLEQRFPIARLRPLPLLPLQSLQQAQGLRWSHRDRFAGFPNTVGYPPAFYLPAAVGWRVGMFLNLTILHSLLLARLLAACSAIALGALAVSLVPLSQKLPLLAFLLLPTILSLNASCSQDALLLPAAALAVALLQRASFATESNYLPLWLGASTLLLCACACARPPYIVLLAALLLPALASPAHRLRTWMWCSAFFILAGTASLAWVWSVHRLGVTSAPDADPRLQTLFLHAHPILAVQNMLQGLLHAAPSLALTSIAVLGPNDVVPPRWISFLLGLAFLGVVLSSPAPDRKLRGRWFVPTVLLILGGVVAAITAAEYVIWTPPGAATVGGLQSRYFLPLLPLAFLLIPRRPRLLLQPRLRAATLVIYLLLVCTIPVIAAHRFYATGLFRAVHTIAR